jgi:choice-of-anchor A domain-containing protein
VTSVPRSSARRRRTAVAALVAVVAALGATALTTATSAPAEAAVGDCPPGTIPGPGTGNPIWTDDNVAVFAGGDFVAFAGAAESEGLMVVGGDATFDKTNGGTFNVGWVGVGSAVAPTPGSVMLAVGGGLTVGIRTILDVGANAFDADGVLRGGAVSVGGTTDPDYEDDGSQYQLNGGALTQGMGATALEPWADWPELLTQQSTEFAALAPTGTVVSGTTLELTGDGTSDPQVFEIDAATLEANPAITFLGLADDVPVIINVTGGPVDWAPNYFADESGRVDIPSSPRFGTVASRTLWNFVDADSVHIGGTSQVLGTMLVPSAGAGDAPALRVTASTNGRLLTNGGLTMDGAGNEHHNYPWIDAPFDCIPTDPDPGTGQVSVTKLIDPADLALLPAGSTLHGLVTCTVAGEPGELIAEWSVEPGATAVVDDLPVGAACQLTESLGVDERRIAPRGGVVFQDAAPRFEWETPVWNPAPPVFTVPAETDPVQLTFTVTNAIDRGAFVIRKVVDGDGAPDVGFTGTWECAMPSGGTVTGSGTWTLSAGDVSDPIEAPVGARCTVTEVAPPPADGGTWETPVIAGSPVTITSGSDAAPVEVTVQNTFTPDPALGGFSIVKVVRNADDVPYDDEFSGTWTCTVPGDAPLTGEWTASNGGPATVVADIPLGAECAVSETAPRDPTGGTWEAPEISPAEFTVTDAASSVRVVVTNTVRADRAVSPDLPITGGTAPTWIIAGGAASVLLGAALLGAALLARAPTARAETARAQTGRAQRPNTRNPNPRSPRAQNRRPHD